MTNEEKLKVAEEAIKRGDYGDAERVLQEVMGPKVSEQERAAALRLRGSIDLHRSDYSGALTNLEESLSIFRTLGEQKAAARTLNNIGNVYQDLADYPKALECFNRALGIFEESADKSGTALVHGNIGNVYTRLADYTKALYYYQLALNAYEELGDKHAATRIVGNMGVVYQNYGEYNKALEYYERSLVFAEEVRNKSGMADSISNIGAVYGYLANYPKALEHFERALALHEELGDPSRIAVALGNIGTVYQYLSDYPQALEYLHRALECHTTIGDERNVAVVMGNMGNVYSRLADYSRALEYLSRACSGYETMGELSGVAHITGDIGGVYYSLADYPRARQYFERARTMFEDLQEKTGVANMAGNIGYTYKELGDFTTALGYFRSALELSEEIGTRSQSAFWLAGIGSIHTVLKQYDEGRRFLQQSLDLRRQVVQTQEGVANLLLELGMLELAEHNNAKAVEYLEEASTLAVELGEKAGAFRAHEELARVYEADGNIDLAYMHYKSFHRLKEEVFSEEARKRAEQVEQQRMVADMERRHAEERVARDQQAASERAAANATTTLLHRVLPSQVAERLLKGERVADYFQNISILFVDIVGFTPIAARMPAKAVLAFLNHVFGEFDRVMKKHGVQKIKTIGDGYMAVSGAPVECSDHAERLARAALELMAVIQLPDDIRKTLPKGSVFHLRMGLHTGSAFAGIVGDEGFVYEVYSDAVNLAARMESSGEPGKIHCSEEFAYHVQNRDESFVFEERGEIEVKGKGVMRTYFLEQR